MNSKVLKISFIKHFKYIEIVPINIYILTNLSGCIMYMYIIIWNVYLHMVNALVKQLMSCVLMSSRCNASQCKILNMRALIHARTQLIRITSYMAEHTHRKRHGHTHMRTSAMQRVACCKLCVGSHQQQPHKC